ncbi:MAG: hypothetical protein GW839_05600 [Flavobacteriales bacterium]|nr:hypothetical protein [Flavobacteriia bacterium]NCP05689.1 hypothetical protein [Flavobacteriales bacterium]NCP51590.1 hypothetical protein [Flavobacteriales bacterium]NCP59763.1 hypothetical protein [Flavobacteriales bacterium]NCP88919.1 hypothetical protein [Flavobacteriales bacterium]
MFIKVFKYLIITLIIVLVSTSCTKEVDFNQVNNIQLTPVIESSLVFINEPANRFLVNGTEISGLQDSANIDVFNDEFVIDYLEKAEFLFQTTNSINRGFQVQVDMLDDFNQIRHTFSFSSVASPDNSDVVNEHIEVFEGNFLTALKNTTKLVFTLNILSGEPINQSTPGRIILKSKGTFYLNIQP